ncbi:uncharacterized protein IL334_003475 [Kwoniella shivajii]|uniref:HhH-GPD domain-containing protein n=1 Tax=Kwoniella shivajii TaxID=564305 RepID=A0ABZ1D0M2_9TREE|nr:hypothetical protein IL334_003475 [Kwoniella shivajii]
MPPRTRAAARNPAKQVKQAAAKPADTNARPAKRQKTQTHPVSSALIPPTLSFSLPNAISHLTKVDPRFAQFFTHLPCQPFVHLEAVDPFQTLVTSIIGQQVSWLAARAINNRFRALYGFDPESKDGFPTPEVVAKEDVTRLKGVGLSTRKAEYVISLAQHFTSGQLSAELLAHGTDEEISNALIAVRGIGKWTVHMFMMFSLRRQDVLAEGDLGVQKGLLRWALSAHGALPKKAVTTPKKGKGKVVKVADGEMDTVVRAVTPQREKGERLPPTPLTPTTAPATLHTPGPSVGTQIPPTPNSPTVPREVVEVPAATLPPPSTEEMIEPPKDDWDPHTAAPLTDGLSVEVLKARLSGKKVKGGMYLIPKEMEVLTDNWRPFRSLGVFYMWPVAGES